jgi:hypothetical protein
MDNDVINLAKSIRQTESGGDFNAEGASGESGAYQWTPNTWKAHAQQALGDSKAPMTPSNQNAVAYTVIKGWKDKGLNPAQIAAKWNSGSETGWENKVGTNDKGVHYDVPKYVKSVTDAYQTIKNGGQVRIDPNNPSSVQPTDTTKPKFYGQQTDTSTNQDPTAPGHVIENLGKGDYGNAIQSGVRNIGSFLTFGGSEQLGKGISSPVAVAGEKIKGLFGGKDNSKYVEPQTEEEKSQVISGGLKTAGSIAALAATPFAVSKGAGLMSKVFGSTLEPEVANQVLSKTGIPLKVFNTLSKTEKLNALGEALKGAQAGDALNIVKAMDKLKPGAGLLNKVMSKGFGALKGYALYQLLGNTIGGIAHDITGK